MDAIVSLDSISTGTLRTEDLLAAFRQPDDPRGEMRANQTQELPGTPTGVEIVRSRGDWTASKATATADRVGRSVSQTRISGRSAWEVARSRAV